MTAAAPRSREAAAEEILSMQGIDGGRVSAAGHEGEIAALSLPDAAFVRLLGAEGPQLARCLKELGFRYVALDLAAAAEGGEG